VYIVIVYVLLDEIIYVQVFTNKCSVLFLSNKTGPYYNSI